MGALLSLFGDDTKGGGNSKQITDADRAELDLRGQRDKLNEYIKKVLYGIILDQIWWNRCQNLSANGN